MKETEITVELLQEVDTAKALLHEKGFVMSRFCLMEDWYFSKFDIEEIKSFSYKDLIKNSFLIRRLSGQPNLCQLIYKNKDLDQEGNVVAEEKVIATLDDSEPAIKAMKCAGLTNWCEIAQKMSIYTNGKIEFVIQEVDGLGTFIEYEEDETVKGLDEVQKIKKMVKTLKELGLQIGEDFSCKKVLLKFRQEMKAKKLG